MIYVRAGGTPIVALGPFVDSSDGVTPETGLTISNTEILFWKDGTLGTATNGGTHSSTGMYVHTLGTNMTGAVGEFVIHAFDSGTTSLPVILRGMVLHADAYDMLMGSGKLPTDTYDIVGTVQTAVTNLQGTATTAAAQSTLAAGLGTTNNTAITNLQGTATTAAAQAILAAGLGTTNNTAITNLQGTCTDLGAILGTIQGTAATLDTILADLSVANIADGVWDEVITGHTDGAKVGSYLSYCPGIQGTLNTLVGTAGTIDQILSDLSVANIADGVWEEATADHGAGPTFGGMQWNQQAILGTIQGTALTLDTILSDLSVANVADAVWDEQLTGATHNVATSAGRRLRGLEGPVAGAIVGGTSNTGTLYTDLTGYDVNFFNGQLLHFTSGTLAGQCRPVLTNGTGGDFTFDEAWTRAPGAADTFDLLPDHIHSQQELTDSVWDEVAADHTGGTTLGGFLVDLHGTLVPNLQGTANAIWADTDNVVGTLIPNLQGTATTGAAQAILAAGLGTTINGQVTNLQGTANAILTDTDVTIPALINGLNDITAAAVGTAVWNYCVEERGTYKAQQIMSIILAVIAGRSSNSGLTFSTPDGNAARVAATVNTSNERTAMTLTPGTGTGV